MPTPNVPMLRKAVEWVEFQAELPEIDREWDQESYYLNPKAHAKEMLVGMTRSHTVYPSEFNEKVEQVARHCGSAYCVAGYIASVVDERYRTTDVVNAVHSSVVAAEALGINNVQAHLLFNGGNSARDVRRLCETYAGEQL